MSRRLNKPDTTADFELRKCLEKRNSFVVVAGAGSGKTTSLIKALSFINKTEGKRLKQQGKRIACITYTTTAEKEILDDVGNDELFHVSTIHSFLWELVRPFQSNIKAWVNQKIQLKIESLIAEKLGFHGRRVQQKTIDKNEKETLRYRAMANQIEMVKEFKYETGRNYAQGILGHNDIIDMVPDLLDSSRLLQIVLTEKYPYFFIDESQDTNPHFVSSMKVVDRNVPNFCLGFFGDPMQKIYMTGAGAISLEQNWQQIDKPENFRCSREVLKVINNIRSGGDPLQQIGGRKEKVGEVWEPVNGAAYLFALPSDRNREEMIGQVRRFLTQKLKDPLWTLDSKEADVRVLVIEHRMAAKRLGFGDLFSAFTENSTDSLSSGFKEGTLWAVQPFTRILTPLVDANNSNRQFEVIELLRRFCPLLQKNYIQVNAQSPRELLASLKNHVDAITALVMSGSATIGKVLEYVVANGILHLDERLSKHIAGETAAAIEDDEETSGKIDDVMRRYFDVPAKQLLGYQTYINDRSVYSTQHSVKGAEFERVLVVLDDEEGKSNFYSYEKLFGISALSETDQKNIAERKDSTLDRTRRLFYVCCSRSLKDLVVVLFVADVDRAFKTIKGSGIFADACILRETDLISE